MPPNRAHSDDRIHAAGAGAFGAIARGATCRPSRSRSRRRARPRVEEHSVAPIDRNAKLHAVLPGIAAGEEGGAGRRTYRMNVELRELDSLVDDAVHVGSGHLRTAVETGLPPAHVVGEEYQDVGPCVCSLIRLCGKLARRRTVRRYRALREGVPARQNDKGSEDEDSALAPVMGEGRFLGNREDGPQDRRQDGEKTKEGPTAP